MMKNHWVQSQQEAPTAPFLRAVPMFLCDYARRRRRGQMHVRLPLDMLLLVLVSRIAFVPNKCQHSTVALREALD